MLTDDPDTTTLADSTETPVFAEPEILVSKFDMILIDADRNLLLSPGDSLQYDIQLVNAGNANAAGVVVTDAPDPNTTLVIGTVETSQGEVSSGNTVGDPTVNVNVGTLTGAGGSATIGFQVKVNDPLPIGIVRIENQATVSGINFDDVLSDDPDTADAGDVTVAVAVSSVTPADVPTTSPAGTLSLAAVLSSVILIAACRRSRHNS